MNTAYLLIGGNIGDRQGFLAKARDEIAKRCGSVRRCSSLYETAAWGLQNQDAFLNQALEVETELSATELLACVLIIEEWLGRHRTTKYGPRVIDIDILFFNHDVVQTEALTVPHPQLQNRRFVLVPMAELAPDFVHPLLKQTITQLLENCSDDLAVNKIF